MPVAGPWITEVEIRAVLEAVTGAWYTNAGDPQREFEETFAGTLGRDHALALPSCTSAIHLSLLALGIGPGDEVIVPESTWIASVAPVTYVGATPVLVDIDPTTWCLDLDLVEAAITERTRAVIAVDLYGSMADLRRLEDCCRRRGLALIEDAAEALGSQLGDRKAGAFGTVSVFSFHGSKTMTTGEGGMLVTDDEALYDRVRFLADHGRHPGDKTFRSSEIAHKYKISSLQCALGLAQLSRLTELVERKRQIFGWYRERLEHVVGLSLNPDVDGLWNSYWMSTVVLSPELGCTKEEVAAALACSGVSTRPFFEPLGSLPALERIGMGTAEHNRVNATRIARTGLNLPSALVLGEPDIDRACEALLRAVG